MNMGAKFYKNRTKTEGAVISTKFDDKHTHIQTSITYTRDVRKNEVQIQF